MPKLPPCFGIIPARYASSRFEGKPLADILGKPMFWHVYRRAVRCPLFTRVTLATDDTRIYAEAARYNVPVVMTGTHKSGTDRVLEAAGTLSIPEDAVVANIQGDEPLLDPEMLTQLLEPFADPGILVTTLATKISPEQAGNPDQVKVVWSGRGLALYFSRSLIPHPRAGDKKSFWGHIGLYAFRMAALRRFAALGPSELETRESLEQLRFLENDIPVYVVPTSFKTTSVDRPEDLEKVIAVLSRKH